MKNITLIILVFLISSCNSKIKEKNRTSVLNIDTLKISIINDNRVFKKEKQRKLTNKNLIEIDSLLKICIENYNSKQEIEYHKYQIENPDNKIKKNDFIIDLKNRKMQYLVGENENKDKIVWLISLCRTYDNAWKNHLILVGDGGNCYFNLHLNLTQKKYYDLEVNGHF